MATKTTGAELKRFYSDSTYWPDDREEASAGGGPVKRTSTWHEDELINVNGTDVDMLTEDFSVKSLNDNDIVVIEGGVVFSSPFYKDGHEPSFESYFKRWRKEQSTTTIVIECDVSKVDAVKAAAQQAGGKVVK